MDHKEIISMIISTKKFSNYKEFKLDSKYKIQSLATFINDLNSLPQTCVLYNEITMLYDNIGVIDISGTRYIDFDDDIWTMTNKGINADTNKYITHFSTTHM
jgi:hypothetical protein